jgi:hypothetical protein
MFVQDSCLRDWLLAGEAAWLCCVARAGVDVEPR